MVTKADLLARARDGRVKPLSVAGFDLHMRRFSLAERIEIGSRARSGIPPEPHEYLAIALCEADGSPFWTLDEAREFCDGDGKLAEQFVESILTHTGLTDSAQEQAAKN
jgi:hypothetical protein